MKILSSIEQSVGDNFFVFEIFKFYALKYLKKELPRCKA